MKVWNKAMVKLAIATGHAMQILMIYIIQTLVNALSLTYLVCLDAGLLA